MLNLRFSLPALTTAALFALAAPTNATVFVGLQQDGGSIITVASDSTGFVSWSGTNSGLPWLQFERVAVTASGQPEIGLPNLIQVTTSQNNNAGPANAGTLKIYVTSTGNPTSSVVGFQSGFATVKLANNWTETLETYLDPGNGLYELTTLLGSAAFSTVNSDTASVAADTGGGSFYSVTAVFTITAPTLGISTSEIGLTDAVIVPEPASLALLGGALLGFGIFARRRRKAV